MRLKEKLLKLILIHRPLIFVIILILSLLATFLNKAFHIDDTLVLYSAREVLKSPIYLCNTMVNWYGTSSPLRLSSNPPLISFYTALIIKVIGENSVWLHIFFLIFPIIITISMYFLSKRFTSFPLISTLLLVSTPAFIVSSTNIMPDVALLAFYLAAVCIFIYGIDNENKLLVMVSGLIGGLASLTKYTGLTLIPLFFFYSLLKRRLSKGLLALIVSFILSGFSYLNIIDVLYCYKDYLKPTFSSAISNLIGSLTYISSVAIFPLLLLFLLHNKKDWFIYFLIIWLSIISSFEWCLKTKYPLYQSILSIFFISTSLFVCKKFIEFLKEKRTSNYSDVIFLLFWLGLIFCYHFFFRTFFTAPRYILILTPPLILLFMKKYEILLSQNRSNIFRSFIYICIALNFLFSVSISFADCIYADTYRNFTQTYTEYLKEMNKKVWFRGHWGFQYYMEKEGFTYLALDDIPKKGDIIIMPSISDHESFSLSLKERLKLIRTIKYETLYSIRTISPKDRINFYSYAIGWLPYGISSGPLEVFQIWQVE